MTKPTEEEMDLKETEGLSPPSVLGSIFAASQFLTLMPPVMRRAFSMQELGNSVAFFPLVGLAIGAFLVGINFLLTLIFPSVISVIIILGLWIVLTGALHLDGFLDACDGLFGGRTPEKRLEIMRDERLGAYAFAGGFILILLKFSSLNSIESLIMPLLLTPTLGRWAMSISVVMFPYGRQIGLGRAIKDHASWKQLSIATLITILTVWFVGGWLGLVALLLVLLITWGVAAFVLRRIPGLTGDIYGAICEISETVVLLFLVAAAGLV